MLVHQLNSESCALAACVDPAVASSTGCVYPSLGDIRTVSAAIAVAVVEDAVARGLCALPPGSIPRCHDDAVALVTGAQWKPASASGKPDPVKMAY